MFFQPIYSGIVFIYSKHNTIKSEEVFIRAGTIVNKQARVHYDNICVYGYTVYIYL